MNNQSRALLYAVIFWLTVPCLAQEQDTFTIEPHWKKGDRVSYELIKTRTKKSDQKLLLDTTSRTDVTIEILDVRDDGYTIAWTLGESKLDDPNQMQNPTLKQMMNIVKDYRLILELDEMASVTGLQNWMEVKNYTTKVLDVMLEELKSAGENAQTLAAIRSQVSSMFASKEQIEMFCTREAQLLFMAVGVELPLHGQYKYEDRLPNPFGGEPFPSQAEYNLDRMDKSSDITRISWRQSIDSDAANKIIEKALKDMSQSVDGPVPPEGVMSDLRIEDSATIEAEISTGWINNLRHKRMTTVEGITQEDIVIFKRIPCDTVSKEIVKVLSIKDSGMHRLLYIIEFQITHGPHKGKTLRCLIDGGNGLSEDLKILGATEQWWRDVVHGKSQFKGSPFFEIEYEEVQEGLPPGLNLESRFNAEKLISIKPWNGG